MHKKTGKYVSDDSTSKIGLADLSFLSDNYLREKDS